MVEKGKRLGKDSRLAQAYGQLACPFPNAPERSLHYAFLLVFASNRTDQQLLSENILKILIEH